MNQSHTYFPPVLFHYTTRPFHFKDWFSIVKILNALWRSLKWKCSWLNCQCTKRFSTFKVIMSHTSFDTGSLFWEISKDAYHLPVISPRTRKAQPAATGYMAAKVKLLRRVKTAVVHCLQADTGPQFRTVYIHISYSLLLICCFSSIQSPPTPNYSLGCFQKCWGSQNAYLTISLSSEKCLNPHRIMITFQLLRLAYRNWGPSSFTGLASPILPLHPHIFLSDHPQIMWQTASYLQAFVHAVLSAWNILPSFFSWVNPTLSFTVRLQPLDPSVWFLWAAVYSNIIE